MEDVVMPLERRGDGGVAAEGLEALYRSQWAGMVRLAFVLVGDATVAEELVQDVFVRMYRSGDTVRDPVPYLRSAVYNASRNHHRSQRVRRRHLGTVADDGGPPFGDHVIDAVRRLRPQRRAVVVLRYYAGLTDTEIAAAMGVPVGTVKSTLHRALAELKEALS
jgi:DNA-directed RNA polymerase specialized sigma24 family protein